MNDLRSQILVDLQSVFAQVFNNATLIIDENSSQENIVNWDSLMHIQLILAIEEKFGFRFTSSEMLTITKVNQIIDIIINRTVV